MALRLGLSIRKVGSGRDRGLYHLEPADAEPQPYSLRKPKSAPPLTLDQIEAELESLAKAQGLEPGDDA